MIAEVVGVSSDLSTDWVSNGGTIEVAWHVAVGLACGVPYIPTKEQHMRALLWKMGGHWDSSRYTSADTDSRGGGNLKREAYLDLFDLVSATIPPIDENEAIDAWQVRAIRVRRGQSKFREGLMIAYEGRCAISGSAARPVLEAAHIRPFSAGGTPSISNGLLLRSDVHTLFDLGLVNITGDLVVEVSSKLAGTEYESLNGTEITIPSVAAWKPDRLAIAERYGQVLARDGSTPGR